MASSNDSSYTEMKGEVEAIGAHCQMEYCHVLDFLPFRCESCQGKFCLDHRTEHAHACTKAGDWAQRRAAQNALTSTNTPLTPKPSLYTHEQQCYERACKTLINTPRMPPNECSTCNHSYCLKHRMPEDHDCKNIPRRGVTPLGGARQQTMSALMKLKLWAENKKKEDEKRRGAAKKTGGFLGLGKSSSSAASTAQAELNALKRTAKGEASVPQEKRVYLHVEASADTTKAKYPTGKFFYNKDWTVGRVLDMAAKALQVQNVNNHGGGEEEKLRVFHVEGGRLLKFNEKIGESCSSGNMIVLLRGVGSGEAPDLIDL
ncbi:nucleic acid binding protein containing the AN1-type Zn-finger [Pyrenophora tritici-repentis]|nr:an1 zinc finger protein [Pyrenophora tritici-repentis]KAI1524174.1 nucleic acid binding protein containing the AN1-type Zn-finger [Pyrenophora tritici-repentis]KAI1524426.1 nucleic acid binding protein containing the AN1-type Zn-finger [Pyrenophora tritici-repentis]KAI1529332.1 nucleic acid binding protein containing the AN1-type Zn-finger [Pyrenophora tritici-repentis]KAI1560549.1 nucleic acid binding protein containing the AN1-type Zn-finger [Pyrenophora tritici-repentis]